MAQRFGWVTATKNAHGRPAQLRRAVKELGGLHQWRALLERCGTSDFLCGRAQARGRQPFSFKLDWALKPANLLKLEEGSYFSAEVRGAASTDTFSQRLKPQGIDWRGTLERYRPGRFWHKDTQGPRPEESGPHKAPADMIEAWRKKHGITGVPAQRGSETREERLAGMIISYRKVGKHADANRLEEELAALEGRPPTLVAHPDARDPDMPPPRPKPPPYRPAPPRSEAEITRAMAAAQDVPWEEIPEGTQYEADNG